MLRAGFNVGITPDNRLMSNVTPSSELTAVAAAHHLSRTEMGRLATNAMMSAFCPIEERQRIITDVLRPAYN